ncbi:MAG: hypothetical protein AAFP28_02730 [Pseudomonadota bacterium]
MPFFLTSCTSESPDAVERADEEADAPVEPCDLFAAEFVEITSFDNSVDVSVGGSIVSPPHWERSREADFQGAPGTTSLVPAAIPTKAGSKATMNVKIEVTAADGLSGTGTLRGALGGVVWEGTFPVSVGIHSVTVETASATTDLAAHRGDIAWVAAAPGCSAKPLATTRVELYRIVEATAPAYLSAGRPVEALRFLYGAMSIGGEDAATATGVKQTTTKITRYLHTSHGLTYDTVRGAPSYIRSNRFNLTGYISRSGGNTVNCYDQASGVQVFSGILGITCTKVYVEPFGFITSTTLVGGIVTNSPFFSAVGTGPTVPQFDAQRTYFGNHEFVEDAAGDVFDACSGPSVGTLDYNAYLNASVDTALAVAAPPEPWHPPQIAWSQVWRRTVDDPRFRVRRLS